MPSRAAWKTAAKRWRDDATAYLEDVEASCRRGASDRSRIATLEADLRAAMAVLRQAADFERLAPHEYDAQHGTTPDVDADALCTILARKAISVLSRPTVAALREEES